MYFTHSDRPIPPTVIFCFNDGMAVGVIKRRNDAAAAFRTTCLSWVSRHPVAGYTDPPPQPWPARMREMVKGTGELLLEILEGKADVTPVSITDSHSTPR